MALRVDRDCAHPYGLLAPCERVASRVREGGHPRQRMLLAARRVGVFFFKQKTAYEIGLGIPAEPLFRSFISRHNSNFFSDKLVLTSVTPASSAPVLQTPKATSSTLYFDSLTVNAGNGGFLHCIQMDTSVNAANQVVSVGADIAF